MQEFYLAPDIEEMCVSYLSGFYTNVTTDIEPDNSTWPLILITALPAGPDDMVTECPCVQIDVFQTNPDPIAARTAASTYARQVHKTMKNWTASVPVRMSDGSYQSIDGLYVEEQPHYEDYGVKEIKRYVMRYHIDLRCNLSE